MPTPISGAPDFSVPGNLTPEELEAFLRRLRFGGSSLTNTTMNPLGERTDTGPTPEGQALEQTPEAVNRMLEFAKSAAPSINGSYTAGVLKRLGRTEGPAAPTSSSEYEKMYPSNTYDLPSDIERRKLFEGGQAAQQAGEKGTADIKESGAKSKQLEASAGLDEAQAKILSEGGPSAAKIVAIGNALRNPNLSTSVADSLAAQLVTMTGGEPAAPAAEAAPPAAPALSDTQKFLTYGPQWWTDAKNAVLPSPPPAPTPAAPTVAPPVGQFPAPQQMGPGPTEKDMVPTPDPNIKLFNGRQYRRLPTGGWMLIK